MKLFLTLLFLICVSVLKAQFVFQNPPDNFNPRFHICACFINVGDRSLFLKRLPNKSEGDKWGIPGGKVDKGETAEECVLREIWEETAIQLPKEQIRYLGKVYIRYPELDFTYHMFEYTMQTYPDIVINWGEHSEFRWITFEEALKLPLIRGEDECIDLCYHS